MYRLKADLKSSTSYYLILYDQWRPNLKCKWDEPIPFRPSAGAEHSLPFGEQSNII